MWLAIKEAAGRRKKEQRNTIPEIPSVDVRQRELGSLDEAIKYGKLYDAHPDVLLGPDEDIQHHYNRLKSADREWRAEDTTDIDRRAADPAAKAKVDEPTVAPWAKFPGPSLSTSPSPSSSLGMPQRIPGWFTGDAMDAAPPSLGVPPMSRRDPGATLRAPVSPSARPERQSREEWIKGLADKDIYLDSDGRRISPQDMVLPRRSPRGHDIWEEFTRPVPAGRHRAARAIVAKYIASIKTAGHIEDVFAGDKWEQRGNSFHKRIGDKNHVLVREPGGWIHNSGPADLEPDEYGDPQMTGTPIMFDDLQRAVLHAHRGNPQVGFRPPPVNQQSLSSLSWRDVV